MTTCRITSTDPNLDENTIALDHITHLVEWIVAAHQPHHAITPEAVVDFLFRQLGLETTAA